MKLKTLITVIAVIILSSCTKDKCCHGYDSEAEYIESGNYNPITDGEVNCDC